MNGLVRYVRETRLKKPDLILGIILCSILFFLYELIPMPDSLFYSQVEIGNGYIAKKDLDGNIYVVDQEHERIIKMDGKHRVLHTITKSTKGKDAISYVGDIAIGKNGDLFVEEVHWGGLYVDREAILVFDADGNYKRTCYEENYEAGVVDKRKVFGLITDEKYLYYAVLEKNSIFICRQGLTGGGEEKIQNIHFPNAYNAIYEVCIEPSREVVYLLDKRGRVLRFFQNDRTVLYDSSLDSKYAGKAAFYKMAVDGDGTVYLTDIKGERLLRWKKGSGELTVLLEGAVLSVNAGAGAESKTRLSIICGDHYYETGSDGTVFFSGNTFPKSPRLLLIQGIALLFLLAAALLGFWILLRLAVVLTGLKINRVKRMGILISVTVTVIVFIIVSQLLEAFQSIYLNELFEKLTLSAHVVSSQLDKEAVKQVNDPEDFMSSQYQTLIFSMEQILDRTYEFNQSIYCNLLKAENGKGYSVAYLDQSTGTYYPLDEVETAEVELVYQTKEDVRNEGKADVAGSFAYVKVPVLDAYNHVIAVVAVGSDTSILDMQIKKMQKDILVTLVTIIVMLLFLFGEILGFFDLKSSYKEKGKGREKEVPLHMIRLIIFLTYLAFNMATSFLPVYAARLVGKNLGIPKELAASMPITLNLAFMAIMSVFCARLMERFQFRTISVVSACTALAGDSIIFLNNHYAALTLGLILNGIGVGLITNCINMYIASSQDRGLRRNGFSIFNSGSLSGINIGSIFGASIAGAAGQQNVFLISSVAWGIVALLFLVLGTYIQTGERPVGLPHSGKKRRTAVFLSSPGVWGYLLCIQIPYAVLNSFIFYYVPIYAANQGFSENTACLLLMVNSLCGVFFGMALTDFFESRFGGKSIYISTFMSLLALLLFAAKPVPQILVITLFIMGISSSFGGSVKSVYFTELEEVRGYGEEKAMGIYNLTDNAGESAGPVILGRLMFSEGLFFQMCKLVSVIFVLHIIYAFQSRGKGIRKEF